jgi:hypothetical protein
MTMSRANHASSLPLISKISTEGANQMSTVWRIAPDQATHARVVEQAKREIRPVANMLLVLVREALFQRQLAEGKTARPEQASLIATIRGGEAIEMK